MEALYPAIFSAIVGAMSSAIAVYVVTTNRLTKVETKIDDLSARVEKHNNVIERTYALEQDVAYLKEYVKHEAYGK